MFLSFIIIWSTVIGNIGIKVSAEEAVHAIYVSVLEIEQDGVEGSGNIRLKVFANDLEDAIFNNSQKRIDLLNGNCEDGKLLVSDYFAKHLVISINNQQLNYKYLSCEINDISIWFNFEFNMPSEWTEVSVKADYLMELFPTQTNVVSINYHGRKRMFRLLKGDEDEKISFTD